MGRTEFLTWNDYDASLGWQSKSNSFNESEMALFYECMLQCARKVLDTADIVRDGILQQLRLSRSVVVDETRRLRSKPRSRRSMSVNGI